MSSEYVGVFFLIISALIYNYVFKKYHFFCEYSKNNFIFAAKMKVTFDKEYLQKLYTTGQSSDKKHRFQPDVIRRYIKVIDIMLEAENVNVLALIGGLHYEHLSGDKNGLSSVRVNKKYRIEFTEQTEGNETIATICNIIELSNHYD